MTLQCRNCGHGWGLEIVSQSYHGDNAYERYECSDCGGTGTLDHDAGIGTTLTGVLE